jgi:4-hydroxy-tetrahydrodipicolinate reductase
MVRVLLVGHGRMGRLVESLAASYDCEVAGIIDHQTPAADVQSGDFGRVDAAIDFSVADAVSVNLPALAARGVNVVIGTTGWQAHERALRDVVTRAGTGVLAGANFAIGMSVFRAAVAETARRFAALPDAGAWIHDAHHAAKKDAPSGTALLLQTAMVEAGYARPIDVSSTRAGSIPGTHTVGFDAASETVTLTHAVRDRAVFARGALTAAVWLVGKRGWFTVDDMIRT